MPGHMNVLLAEAQVPYEQLKEMSEIDPEFKQADVALVVGANDVVNPAAETTPGAPIYGMPILHANQARQVVFMKRSMRPGFAGIENELLYEPTDHFAVRRRQGHDGQAARRAQGPHRITPPTMTADLCRLPYVGNLRERSFLTVCIGCKLCTP